MAFGQMRKAHRSNRFGQGQLPFLAGGGLPSLYDIDWNAFSWLGVPFYWFSSDWDTAQGGANINFTRHDAPGTVSPTTFGGTPSAEAQVGDRIDSWKNICFPVGQGDAVVAKDSPTHPGAMKNYFRERGHPRLVEKTYNGRAYRGLEFTGTEYLQIKGSEVSDAYGVPSPMFSTSGAPWAVNKGATFLLVIDQAPIDQNSVNPLANGVQSLLLSRQPAPLNSIPQPVPHPFVWPSTEDLGIQYFRNGSSWSETIPQINEQRWGPEGSHFNFGGQGIPVTTIVPPDSSQGLPPNVGSAHYGYWTVAPPNPLVYANPGFQIILLEYDANDIMSVKASTTTSFSDVDAIGPRVKIWGMSSPNGAWGDANFDEPKLLSASPAMPNHTLFDKEHLFLGGTPPVIATPLNLEMGNGFRGTIYEVMMLETILTPEDKLILQRQLAQKYSAALM